jgi:hypothetical protein
MILNSLLKNTFIAILALIKTIYKYIVVLQTAINSSIKVCGSKENVYIILVGF